MLKSIGSILQAALRLVGFGKRGVAKADLPATPVRLNMVPAIMVPAVAGFVMRIAVDRFLLSRRLASVARLNTPVGRKPWAARKRATDLPPVPVARLGAKKVRLNANRGRRLTTPIVVRPVHTANVVPFPAVRGPAAVLPGWITKAA